MTYDEFVSRVVQVVEATGAAIMILGGLAAFIAFALSVGWSPTRADAYRKLRRRIGRAIVLGLEVLIVGDIVRTIIVDPTIRGVAVLGMIVAVRIVLSFALEIEIDGVWPWSRWRLEAANRVDPPNAA